MGDQAVQQLHNSHLTRRDGQKVHGCPAFRHVIDLRTPGILGSDVNGDLNVLCVLNSAKTLDRERILGIISNGIAEEYKSHSFPCLSDIQKVFSFCITLSNTCKELWFPGKQDKPRSEGSWEA